ncbi:hypothetical protein BD408DRAFT_487280 [Parasitella parasitica]|nr:hypothetical protein BD408DRAFT_487280 [Parasitella parasitica]
MQSLDVGLNFDHGIFTGKGYVVLGRNVEEAQPLQHQLHWDNTLSGKDNWQVLLYWNTMPVYWDTQEVDDIMIVHRMRKEVELDASSLGGDKPAAIDATHILLMVDRHHTINIATLNCRSLAKQDQPHIIPHFTRSLRNSGNNLFVFQEANTTMTEQVTTLDISIFILGDFNYDITNDAMQRLAYPFVKNVKQTYMLYDWTDHELLSIRYQFDFTNDS